MAWCIWKARCDLIFNNRRTQPAQLFHQACNNTWEQLNKNMMKLREHLFNSVYYNTITVFVMNILFTYAPLPCKFPLTINSSHLCSCSAFIFSLMASWFGWKKSKKGREMGVEKKVVLDGSEIRELVENKEAFGSFIDHKFDELDRDHDGKLSVSELQPAVADIGTALGLPAQGSSPDSDHIYSGPGVTLFLTCLNPFNIVAHSENTFNGTGIQRLLSNSFELNKLLDAAWRDLPKDHGKVTKDYLRITLDGIASSANLPPLGAVPQVDAVVKEAFMLVNADDGKKVDEQEFKKLITEILGSIMLQLQGNAIFVSSNSVIHETIPSSSTLLPPISTPPV